MQKIKFNKKSVESLLRALPHDHTIYYFPNPGNAGDAAIALGTYSLFERLKITPTVISFDDLKQLKSNTILFGGGGNLVEGKYSDMHEALSTALVQDNYCILLPHTILGFESIVNKCLSDKLIIFCREKTSYELCALANSLNTKNIFLDDDMAFHISNDIIDHFKTQKGTGTAYCLRKDSESAHLVPIPTENIDISLSWNGDLWQNRELTTSVVKSLLAYLSQFESIRTDRLHIAILGSLLEKRVFLYPNSYYKNRAVYEMSLSDKSNVFFINTSTDLLHSDYIRYLLDKNNMH